VPVLVLRHGTVAKRGLAALEKDPRVELLYARGATPDWVALGHRVAGTLVVTEQDPLSALTFALTAGLRAPLVVAMHKRNRSECRDLMEAGASGCLTLPLTAADVRKLLKQLQPAPSVARMDATLRLLLDPITRIVRYRNKPVQLSQREFTVLHCLTSRHGRPVSAEEVLNYVWADERSERSRQILDVYICHLRRKLARVGLKDAITTLRGYGYSLTALADPQ
jgi:DNA-binding response OmpR family regulator